MLPERRHTTFAHGSEFASGSNPAGADSSTAAVQPGDALGIRRYSERRMYRGCDACPVAEK